VTEFTANHVSTRQGPVDHGDHIPAFVTIQWEDAAGAMDAPSSRPRGIVVEPVMKYGASPGRSPCTRAVPVHAREPHRFLDVDSSSLVNVAGRRTGDRQHHQGERDE